WEEAGESGLPSWRRGPLLVVLPRGPPLPRARRVVSYVSRRARRCLQRCFCLLVVSDSVRLLARLTASLGRPDTGVWVNGATSATARPRLLWRPTAGARTRRLTRLPLGLVAAALSPRRISLRLAASR